MLLPCSILSSPVLWIHMCSPIVPRIRCWTSEFAVLYWSSLALTREHTLSLSSILTIKQMLEFFESDGKGSQNYSSANSQTKNGWKIRLLKWVPPRTVYYRDWLCGQGSGIYYELELWEVKLRVGKFDFFEILSATLGEEGTTDQSISALIMAHLSALRNEFHLTSQIWAIWKWKWFEIHLYSM